MKIAIPLEYWIKKLQKIFDDLFAAMMMQNV